MSRAGNSHLKCSMPWSLLSGYLYYNFVYTSQLSYIVVIYISKAIAAQCRFIRLGAPTGTDTLLLNRILQIREELISRKLHEPTKAHLFASDFEQ